MKYIKVEFTSGLSGEGYQEVDDGIVQRLTDLDGSTLTEPDACEYHITDSNPVAPIWGQ